ncbi:MAG: hypothetical protein HYT80_06460 [Euryarchaeota archaeon]|nr:hypothetical protein [Euryarchaeota archaeon]
MFARERAAAVARRVAAALHVVFHRASDLGRRGRAVTIAAARRVASWPATQAVGRESRFAAPFAILYGLALGGILVLGAHLSNASPSRSHPFGWPGPSTFDNGVAMVRDDLELGAALPALLLGLTLVRRVRPTRPSGLFVTAVLTDVAAVVVGALLATQVGSWGAAATANEAYWAFFTAHALLGLSFFAVGLLPTVVAPSFGVLMGGFVGLGFLSAYDKWVKWRIFRQLGYEGIMAGAFPLWFYVAQVLSPLSTYRGILITWRPQFRDWEEKAALDGVVLPPWVNPAMFSALHFFVWVIVPLEAAIIAWVVRTGRTRAELGQRAEPGAASPDAGG